MMAEELTPPTSLPVQCAGLATHCCYRLQESAGGKWIDIGGKHISEWEGQRISHGMCPDCHAAYKRDRAAKKLRKEGKL